MPRAAPDLTGQKFALLTAIRMVGRNKRGNALWECSCECGGSITIEAARLKLPGMRSCGCMVKKRPYTKLYKHGMTDSPEWAAWKSMHERCTNPNHKWFHRYGGRGVKVCEKWADFNAFFADMGERPRTEDRYSLERIDNAKGYESGNCKWATLTEQNRNRSNVRMLTFEGRTMSLPEWADERGMTNDLLSRRIRLGWSDERAVGTPIGHSRQKGQHG